MGSNPTGHILQAPLVGIGRHVQLKPELAEKLEVRDFYGAGDIMAVKMVLVIRKDLKMRRGKEIAQACHGAVGAILKDKLEIDIDGKQGTLFLAIDKPMYEWIQGSFRKITVTVDSEEELMGLYKLATELDIRATLIEDNGLTEFHGEKTKTVLALGPDYDEKIDQITGHLKLY